jgi:hypothetical protein
MSQLNINQIAVALALTLIAMADVHAQTCPTVSSDTTVTSSCNTGIRLTGNNNLTIGTPTSGQVEITYLGSFISIGVNGTGNTISNTASGEIIAGTAFGIANYGTINILTNSGIVSAGNSGTGIGNASTGTIAILTNSGTITALFGYGIINDGTITTLTNSGTITVTAAGAGAIVNAFTGTIGTLTNSGTVSAGASGIGIENDGTGTIVTLTNSGTISAGDNGIGIINEGTIDALTNSATIAVGTGGYGIANDGTITTLTNSGSISAGIGGYGIDNVGTITTFTNSGTISVGDNGSGISNAVASTITTLTNSGTISAGAGFGIVNYGTIDTLTNSGTISVGNFGIGIDNVGIITTLNNSGTITALDGYGIYNSSGGTITNLNNLGTISAEQYGIYNWLGTINTLTNSGTISVGVNGYGIYNADTIGILNNAQGGNGSSPSTTALTYSGNLPTNYNVIINSATHYGQLAVTNPGLTPITNLGIYGAPFITSRTYSSVLSGTALPTGTSSGTYDNMTFSLVANGAAFDLAFAGVSLMGTQQSLANTAAALQNTYALQSAVLANSFSYDCPVFGEHNVCVSAGGRNTAVSAANGLNNTSALLIAAYRIKPTLRIGAYADQNLSVNNAGSTVNLGNSTPLIGLFGVWNQRIDGTGTEVKVAAAYGQKNTTVNRQVVGLSEAGTGSSNLNSQGAQITAKYGFAVLPDMLVSPYVGMRYTQNNMGGYTEGASSTVTAPLTYSALNTNATTALAGVGASYRFIPKATAFASAGVETDTNTSNGTYSATGITGLTPVNFNPNPVKTRPTATLGAYYDIVKNQRIGITGIYRQESYQAISTTTVMATYTIGL